jgi:hypothetical protein
MASAITEYGAFAGKQYRITKAAASLFVGRKLRKTLHDLRKNSLPLRVFGEG